MIAVGPSLHIPGANRVDADPIIRMTSFHHGASIAPPQTKDLVVRHNEERVFVDERIGVVFPLSHARVDGEGRQVSTDLYTSPKRELPDWLI